jgi:hypothetical protein
MNRKLWGGVAVLWVLAVLVAAVPAQTPDAKEKPALYSYVSNWAIPRAQWADMAKASADDQKTLDKALADGTIVGYGSDMNMIHEADGETHDDWWSATSMAGLLHVLEQFYKSGTPTSPVLASATKHWDSMYVSHHYNWHAGSWKDVYTHTASYKLKKDAPDDAVEMLSKSLMVPLMEKMLAEGAIHEYEIDTQAIHTGDPNMFFVFYIAANAEGLDKVNAGLQAMMKANPLGGPAFGSMVDFTAHRDGLLRSTATYK